MQRYGGDVAKAAAAYNGGMGRVDRAIRRAGDQWTSVLPPETQAYVQKVVGSQNAVPQLIKQGVPSTGGAGGAQPTFNLDPSLTGAAVLDHLPEPIKRQVLGLVEGRQVLPARFASTPAGQAVLAAANQYDPNFDMVNYNSRAKTRADFTSGKSAVAVTAFDTLAQHVDTLAQHYGKMNNGSFPAVNSIRNGIRNATGDGRSTAFNTDVQAVASEAVRAFRGVGGAEADIQAFKAQFTAAQSPAQAMAAVQALTHLVRGRVEALQEQYNRGMGTTNQGVPHLSDSARAAFDRYDPQGASPQARPAQQPQQQATSHDRAPPMIGQTVVRNGKSYQWTGSTWRAR